MSTDLEQDLNYDDALDHTENTRPYYEDLSEDDFIDVVQVDFFVDDVDAIREINIDELLDGRGMGGVDDDY